MNWTEKLFLGAVFLVGGAVILVTLGALGIPIPYVSDGRSAVDSEGPLDDIPPPVVPSADDEDGLLAELDRLSEGPGPMRSIDEGPAAFGVEESAEDAAAAVRPGGADGTGKTEGDGAPKVRDPMVDKLKAKVDTKDPGEIMAFLIGTFTPNGTKLGEEDLEFLFAALGEHDDYGLRNLLLTHLERIGGDGVTKGVLAFMEEEKNPAALRRALNTLRSQNDEAAVNGLVDFMAKTKNRGLREVAFQNLLQTKNGSATESLLTILDQTQDRSLKRYALAAASQLGGADGTEAVLRYATSSDPYERGIGLKSLRDIRSPDAVPSLTNAVARQTDPVVRSQAIRALGRIRDPGAIQSVSQVALDDPNRWLRMEAVRSLASIGRSAAIPTLQYISENDANKSMKRAADKAIQAIEKSEARRAERDRRKSERRR